MRIPIYGRYIIWHTITYEYLNAYLQAHGSQIFRWIIMTQGNKLKVKNVLKV